jgi:hypothetical protein
MSRHDLQNEKLDQIRRKLFKTAKLSGDEIEKIAATPHLFDSVLSRIKTEERLKQTLKRSSSISAITAFLYGQKAVGAFGISTFLLIGAALFAFKEPASRELVEHAVTPKAKQKFTPVENIVQVPEIENNKVQKTKNRVRSEKITFKPEKSKALIRSRKQSSAELQKAPKKQQTEVFYSLPSFGTWETDGEILQIVRTEIPRAELFALGVNLAGENESAKVKTVSLSAATA